MNLKIKNFQDKYNVPEGEHEVLDYWDQTKAFERSVSERPESKRYVFYDGPPFATGLPHYGHILASVAKDVVPRYWTMRGYRVDRVWGWDCHGIPIENMIEKELELKGGKKGIEEMGIGNFNAACRSAILRFDKEWEKVVRRIGRWVDFKHSYKTMDKTYMESIWWAFKTLNDKGLIYEGRRVILYCPRCATPLSNFEIAMDNSYKELSGPSTTYKYKVIQLEDTYFLAWSTTPWNKLATPALAVNPLLTYVKIKQGDDYFILAKNTLSMLTDEPYVIIESYNGKDLEKFTFELHYDFYPRKKGERAGVVIADEYVTEAEGTGIVTLAVYGEDDYRVMLKHHVQLVEHVDSEGKLKPEVIPWQGMFMLKVNPLVNEDLARRGRIYHTEERVHSVPVCYRCETRLYHAPVPAWFINIQKIKPQLIAANAHINWYPSHLKDGRFGKGLEGAPDWNISRSRYWGTPMPIWKGENTLRIIGSVEELKQWAVDPKQVEKLTDIHREFVDDIEVWVDEAKTVKGKRIPEVFDCWVESGSMPFASLGYPKTHRELFSKTHPAQFITEYIAQTRAWFYTLHVMSVALFGKHTFENAVTTGTILATDGTKMSKSKKNYSDPTIFIEKYGVDALRFYLMSSVVMKAENVSFSEDGVKDVYQKVISIYWNVFSFYKLYCKGEPPKTKPVATDVMDQWILMRLTETIQTTTNTMNGYDTVATCRILLECIDDLSTWYLRRSRDRIADTVASQAVLGWVLSILSRLLAPLTPFIAERVYQNLWEKEDSVHLSLWPTTDQETVDQTLLEHMRTVRILVERAHAVRKSHEIKLRQPLASVSITYDKALPEVFQEVLRAEVNVLKVFYTKAEGLDVSFDTVLTKELIDVGRVRTAIRDIQILRKEKECRIDEHIALILPNEYKSLSEKHLTSIQKETLSDSISWATHLSITSL